MERLDLDCSQQETQHPYTAARFGILFNKMHTTKALGLLFSCPKFQAGCKRKNVDQAVFGRWLISRWQRQALRQTETFLD